jgi:manganese/iron transport system ATP-binding protein
MMNAKRDASTTRAVRPSNVTAHDPGAPAVEARGLAAAYDGRVVLRDVSFAIRAGERLAVVGPNGAGKSTLLKIASGLLPAAGGTLHVHGHAPRDHLCVAYVPQRTEVDWRFPLTAADVVLMGRTGRLGALRRPGPRDRELALSAIRRVGLDRLAGRQIGELSGGEQQRMFIARAMAQEADVVLLDEPLAGLDVPATADVVAILDRLERATIVVALHDLAIAAGHFDRILLLRERMISFGAPADAFHPDFLQEAYGGCVRMVRTAAGNLVVHDDACTRGPHDGT